MFDINDPVHLQLILAEMHRRAEEEDAIAAARLDFANYDFAKQAAAVHSPAKKLAVFCPRRSGKSQALARRLAQRALDTPDTPVLYVGLTNKSCRRIFWNDAWKRLKKEYPIPGKTYRTGEHEFPNGSVLYSLGMDADEEQMGKLLGGQYGEIAIDEAQKFRINVEELVYEVLEPATVDLDGTIGLYGTPDDYLDGLFYEVTRTDGVPRRADWTIYEWTPLDNPFMVVQMTKKLEEIKRLRPEFMLTPAFKRMYLGQWVVDDTKRIYKYSRSRNYIDKLPEGKHNHIIGVDLGFNDECAFIPIAYGGNGRKVYIREVMKQSGLLLGGIRERIEYFLDKYDADWVIIDGANKTLVETMKDTYGLPLLAADKVGKHDFIDLMNSEFISGNIMLVGEGTKPLEEEYEKLVWDKKGPKKKEHDKLPNHACDAALYGWRYIYKYLEDDPGVTQKHSEEDKIEEALEKEMRRKNTDFDMNPESFFDEYNSKQNPWGDFYEYG